MIHRILLNISLSFKLEYTYLAYTTQVNSAFGARWLASSEVISQVLFTYTSVNNC